MGFYLFQFIFFVNCEFKYSLLSQFENSILSREFLLNIAFYTWIFVISFNSWMSEAVKDWVLSLHGETCLGANVNNCSWQTEHDNNDDTNNDSLDCSFSWSKSSIFPNDISWLWGFLKVDFTSQELLEFDHLWFALLVLNIDDIIINACSS